MKIKYHTVFISLFIFNLNVNALTTGGALSAPNQFWPNDTLILNSPVTLGDKPSNNPDLFCAGQLGNWRVPSIVEIDNKRFDFTTVFSVPNFVFTKNHFSYFIDGDINKPIKMKDPSGIGSLYGEWGRLSKYNLNYSGWIWLTEIRQSTTLNTNPTRYSYFLSSTDTIDTLQSTEIVNTKYKNLCVHDLVPTPLTPNPGAN